MYTLFKCVWGTGFSRGFRYALVKRGPEVLPQKILNFKKAEAILGLFYIFLFLFSFLYFFFLIL